MRITVYMQRSTELEDALLISRTWDTVLPLLQEESIFTMFRILSSQLDELSALYPHLTSDEKYNVARLCIAAILAKIHTIEWTPTLTNNSFSTLSPCTNWVGLEKTLSIFFQTSKPKCCNLPHPHWKRLPSMKTISVLIKLYTTHHIKWLRNFCCPPHTSFASRSDWNWRWDPVLQEISFRDARKIINETNVSQEFLHARAKTPARTLSLRNSPNTLNILAVPGLGKINLAEIQLQRDRERMIPRYNDARRQLLLEPQSKLEYLTDDKEGQALLKSVYTDIEQVDFMVGWLVDKERPERFALGVVPYRLFVIIASSRFYQEGFTDENYTPWGIKCIKRESFHSILVRNFPELSSKIPKYSFSNDWGS